MVKPSTVFQDIDGQFSSKRTVAFIAMACLVVGFLAAIVGHVVPEYMFTNFTYIVGAGLGLAATERFAPKGS